jgi:hypothetical protein
MAAMTQSWTDERLEERFDAIDRRFDRVDADFRELRSEMNSRFDATQCLIFQIGAGMLATLVVGFTGVITQL